jgi:hypothetical protein
MRGVLRDSTKPDMSKKSFACRASGFAGRDNKAGRQSGETRELEQAG